MFFNYGSINGMTTNNKPCEFLSQLKIFLDSFAFISTVSTSHTISLKLICFFSSSSSNKSKFVYDKATMIQFIFNTRMSYD